MKDYNSHETEDTVFSISITRKLTVGNAVLTDMPDGTGSPVSLPVPVFLISDYDAIYASTIKKYLPNNGSVVFESLGKTPDNKGLVFTFSNGSRTVVETITVTMDGNDYVSTLNFTRAANFLLTKPKIKIDNALSSAQFDQNYYVIHKSGLTFLKQDSFKPAYFEADTLPNDKVRDIDSEWPIDNERGIVPMIIPYANGNVINGVSWTSFIIVKATDIRKVAVKKEATL